MHSEIPRFLLAAKSILKLDRRNLFLFSQQVSISRYLDASVVVLA
jgi:hypothetical protein